MIVEQPMTLQQIWGLETKSTDNDAFFRTGHFGDAYEGSFLITSLLLFQYLLCDNECTGTWLYGK